MLTDAKIRQAMRAGRNVTLTDAGRRGDGRLVATIRAMPSGALCEWYARQIANGQRRTVKLGTYPIMSLATARKAFTDLAPAIRNGEHLKATGTSNGPNGRRWAPCSSCARDTPPRWLAGAATPRSSGRCWICARRRSR